MVLCVPCEGGEGGKAKLISLVADTINLTQIGVAVYVSMDIPEIFLAVRSLPVILANER